MAVASTFSPAQYEVLNVVSCLNVKEDLEALKDVLTQFLNSRLQKEIDRLYDNGTLSDEKMAEFAEQHLRTPYRR